ncbi:MAG: hypothetical protein IKW98_01700 [Prevotella sp.]|nr:hypothetical protein [Prevotella sp.]
MKKTIDLNRLHKQEYMKPTMKFAKIEDLDIICTSPEDGNALVDDPDWEWDEGGANAKSQGGFNVWDDLNE